MEKRNIVVIGASAGGFEAIKQLVSNLPADLEASVFIVWHMSPDVRGILPQVLNKQQTLHAAHAVDKEPILCNRIYIAPPDMHMLIERGRVRITHGPKENRFRPAVDPLFRSAAYAYGSRVIGVVLSGALDDGTAGLWTIKHRGGLAMVQDPEDAEFPSMPENALRAVEVDYKLAIPEMASWLVNLCREEVSEKITIDMKENEKINREVRIALQEDVPDKDVMKLGELTPYTCPECHGVLTSIKDGDRVRFRCHTGHAFSADSLMSLLTENIEDSLWNAIRGIEESIMLLNNLGDHFAASNLPKIAAVYFKKAKEAESRSKLVRQAVRSHEQLSADSIKQQAELTDYKLSASGK